MFILVVLAGVSAGVYAWTRNGKKSDGRFKEVEVTQGSIVEKAVAVGQKRPRQKFSVKSKIFGNRPAGARASRVVEIHDGGITSDQATNAAA